MFDTCTAGTNRTAVLLVDTAHQLATSDPGLRFSHRVELFFCDAHHEPVDRLQVGTNGPHCWAHRTDLARLIFEEGEPHMKAISTTYRSATTTHAARFVATDSDGNRATVPASLAVPGSSHAAAAAALCQKMNWGGLLIGAHTRTGMVWVWRTGAVELLVKKQEA